MPRDISVRDFLDGVTLSYSWQGREHEATYRVSDGVIYLDVDEKVETDDVGARRVYWNLTGGKHEE